MSGASGGKPRMGRPSLVDSEAIVRTAVEIGFDRLTMSAVAAQLGVTHSALYRYFATRDALACAAIDSAVESVRWPHPGESWHDFLVATAEAYWTLYENHPGLALEVSTLRSTSQGMVSITNRSGVALIDFGFAAADAVLVIDMLGELVTQAFLGAATLSAAATASVVDGSRQRRVELMRPWLSHYDSRLRDVFAEAIDRPPRDQFGEKLAVFLDGVSHRAGRH